MASNNNPKYGIIQPTLRLKRHIAFIGMGRSPKSTTGRHVTTALSALSENLRRTLADRFGLSDRQITPLADAYKVKFGPRPGRNTIYRALNKQSISVSNLEKIADRLGVAAYELLVPTEILKRLTNTDLADAIRREALKKDRRAPTGPTIAEELQPPSSSGPSVRRPV